MFTYNLSPGDQICFFGRDWKSKVIETVTRGPSHIAQVAYDTLHGLVLWESTTLCALPDLYTDKSKTGVAARCPLQRINDYDGAVYHLPLAKLWRLSDIEQQLQQEVCMDLHRATYGMDAAIMSGTQVFARTAFLPYPNYNALFCSEFSAIVAMRLGRLAVGNAAYYNPARLVRTFRRSGVYGNLELLKGA